MLRVADAHLDQKTVVIGGTKFISKMAKTFKMNDAVVKFTPDFENFYRLKTYFCFLRLEARLTKIFKN